MSRVALLVAWLATGICSDSQAFVTPSAIFSQGRGFLSRAARHSRDACHMSTSPDLKELGLTPELERLTKVFQSCPTRSDRQLEILRLAHLGGKFYEPLMTEENKVLGCLPTVYVAAEVKEDGLVYFVADSDSIATKGLARLLSKGLSGNTPESIQTVKPEFIKVAGLHDSLTEGQTNGLISILRTMKAKALSLGGDPAGRAGMKQAMPGKDEEEKQEGGAMAARTSTDLKELGLTPELERLTKMFRSCTSNSFRQMELWRLADRGGTFDPSLMTEENKVLVCFSAMYVAAEVNEDGLVYFQTDSDNFLVKVLARLLSKGLSGNTPESIQAVKPEFIRVAGLDFSVTEGYNSGFPIMLETMKSKAFSLGGEPALRAAMEQAMPAEVEEE